MKNNMSTGSFSQSFLDLLFGALGAVVLLFILISITSGPPPRPQTPISRYISWTIVSEDLPASKFALYWLEYGTSDPTNPPLRYDFPEEGEEIFTTDNIERKSVVGILTCERKNVKEGIELRITAEVPSDEYWQNRLAMEVLFEKAPTKATTVIIDAAPGGISSEGNNQKTFSVSELGKRLRIESVIQLKELGGGLLPSMEPADFKVEFKEKSSQ